METLSIDNREFVKAAVIAKELGYTSDYVGQLCRAKKVASKLVGRTWYVDRHSITNHKRNRYKKVADTAATDDTYAVAINREAPQTPSIDDDETVIVSVRKGQSEETRNFYTRVRQQPTVHQYDEDEHDLIPLIKKTRKKLSIGLADASSVTVSSDAKAVNFVTTERPKLRFKGALAVEDIPEPEVEEVVKPAAPVKAKSVKKTTLKTPRKSIKPKPNRVVVSSPDTNEAVAVHIDDQLAAVTTRAVRNRRRKRRVVAAVSTDTVYVPSTGSTTHRYTLVLSVVAALFFAVMVLGLETHVISSEDGLATSYSFTIEALLASVYGSK